MTKDKKYRALVSLTVLSAILVASSIATKVFWNPPEHIPTYYDRPTSYWRDSIIRSSERRPLGRICDESEADVDHLMFEGDQTAAPVLLELANDEDPRVRAFAARSLGKRKHWDLRIVMTLKRLKKDAEFDVRSNASEALADMKQKAPIRLP